MMMTRAQRRTLFHLEEMILDYGYPPTVRELQARMGYASPSTVQIHLKALRNLGFIEGAGRKLKVVRR